MVAVPNFVGSAALSTLMITGLGAGILADGTV
jgi:hypothetical protein